MLGTASLGAVAIVGGIGFLTHLGGQPTARFNSEEQRIARVLPMGFAANSCKTATSVPGDAMAGLDCFSGPLQGHFALFADPDSMNRAFQNDLTNRRSDYVPSLCPGVDHSPTTWHFTVLPDQPAGQISCGTFKGAPDVEWTRNRQLLLLDVHGGHDLNSLFQWWSKFGDSRHSAFVR